MVKAHAAQRINAAAGGPKGLGINSEDRRPRTDQCARRRRGGMIAQGTMRDYQAQVERLQAQLDDEIDERRKADRASCDHLSTALETVSVHADEGPDAITILATPKAAQGRGSE